MSLSDKYNLPLDSDNSVSPQMDLSNNNGLTEIAGLDIDGRVKKRGWTLQDLTLTDDFAGVDIAGLDIEGLDIDGVDNGGPDIDGLDIARLDIDGRLCAIDYRPNILTQ